MEIHCVSAATAQIEDGTIIRRHHDQLLKRTDANNRRAIPMLDPLDVKVGEIPGDIPAQQAVARPLEERCDQDDEAVRR